MFVFPTALLGIDSGSPPPPGPGPVFLAKGANNGPTIVLTTVADCPAGSLIVYCEFDPSHLDQFTGIVDDALNVYVPINNGGGNPNAECTAIVENCAHLPIGSTVTVTQGRPSGGAGSIGILFYIPGAVLSSSLDVLVESPNNLSSSTVSLDTGTLAQADEVLVGCAGNNGGQTYSPSAPFDLLADLGQNFGGPEAYLMVTTAAVSSTATQNFTATAGGSVFNGGALLSFKLA